jgi:hypothetical protein
MVDGWLTILLVRLNVLVGGFSKVENSLLLKARVHPNVVLKYSFRQLFLYVESIISHQVLTIKFKKIGT